MDPDFFTKLWNAPSLIIFLDEIVVLLGIVFVSKIEKVKRFVTIPKAFFESMRSILLVIMPTIAFFNALAETHIPVYYSVLIFLVVFVGWYAYLLAKYRVPKTVTGMFIGLLLFIIIIYAILYSVFR